MSSSVVDIVKAYFGTFSVMSADKAALFLADNFQAVGLAATPLGKESWVQWMNALKTAMPDLKIKLSEVQVDGNVVSLVQHSTGTHRKPMDLSALALPILPASDQTIDFPSSRWEITVVDGKITQEEMIPSHSSETGLPGILKAFGVVAPPV